jgi:hypothetical protein
MPIDTASVTDLEDVDHPTRIIDAVDDPVAVLAHAVPLLFADQLLGPSRSRIVAKGLDATHDPLAFSLRRDCLDLLDR